MIPDLIFHALVVLLAVDRVVSVIAHRLRMRRMPEVRAQIMNSIRAHAAAKRRGVE
jgi:phosphoribosyl-ATP pyrophosphohydrolase